MYLGDCLEVLRGLEPNSIDSVVTDPPAGIGFMGKEWDSDKGGREKWVAWFETVMKECLRVMKPGAHAFVWAIPRTSHWTGTALENAGFEVRDVVTHLFGSGFPKSLDISKAIDKTAGDEAKQWSGWGTALKPAAEFWFLVRKPLSESTVAKNVLRWGTGGLNIDVSRVEAKDQFDLEKNWNRTQSTGAKGNIVGAHGLGAIDLSDRAPQGRFPANLLLDEVAAEMLDQQSGDVKSSGTYLDINNAKQGGNVMFGGGRLTNAYAGQTGGASRFFYCAKTSKSERNAGLDRFHCAKLLSNSCAESTALVRSLLRDISDSEAMNLNIVECGESIMVLCPTERISTIKTTLRQIIELKIWNLSTPSPTSDCTPDASLSPMDGTSPVKSVELSSELTARIGILVEKVGSVTAGVNRAIYESLLKLSKDAAWTVYTSSHPTIKPQKLMRYLINLITPPKGIVLDPFMGSGSTGCAAMSDGFEFIGIEREPEYFEIAKARIEHLKSIESSN